mmetsp:Transcript_1928/g.4814  ORF Transcript_1928/g.4814 Transcript_1928/m.4814 type:complete len:360 (-) Transcript_1928:196-1275(-)|eukprot:CAMPEP_0182925628 /NCGR_PEP_ID=MMETSP0105_2-20130417/9771_1 /TAXON_ID=81532 ORGANISM="Acanthoeca-like sp., Strain 10tr" /NCGR_SAMPLE_ID=MMETSP0105_2 /ASSEMBLY_ACC=CAM_ASM_000205 /LENGTH=359 /DNA_ID=CAMNT_0025063487 /DNA_START=202 /DNA_END=1281 /DNA_ORIENTATION=+
MGDVAAATPAAAGEAAARPRRRSLPKPGAGPRRLPSKPGDGPPKRSISLDGQSGSGRKLPSLDLDPISERVGRTRSVPTPPSRNGLADTVVEQKKRIAELKDELEESDRASESKAAELEAKLKASQQAELLSRGRVADLQLELANLSTSAADRALSEAKERSHKTAIEKLEAILAAKTRECEVLEIKVMRLEKEGASGSADAVNIETIKQLESRLEASKKRNNDQAAELGKFAARVESMQQLLDDKEDLVENYRSMIATQTSQLSSLQGMHSNVQAELVSLKVFSNEQSGFVTNLNEENAKLVNEIQRLKSQAETRDRQLHESVAIAKKALLKQKDQNEKLHAQLQEAKRSSRDKKSKR